MYKIVLLTGFVIIVCIILKIFWNTKAERNVEIIAMVRILANFFHLV